MQPFLLIPIGIVNSMKAEKQVTARIQPELIEYYYPGFNDGTVIVMKSGNSFLTTFAHDQFDEVLISYQKMVKSKQGKFGNIEIK